MKFHGWDPGCVRCPFCMQRTWPSVSSQRWWFPEGVKREVVYHCCGVRTMQPDEPQLRDFF